jgi:hypothetical protein
MKPSMKGSALLEYLHLGFQLDPFNVAYITVVYMTGMRSTPLEGAHSCHLPRMPSGAAPPRGPGAW